MKLRISLVCCLLAAISPLSAQEIQLNKQSAEELLQRGLLELNKLKDKDSSSKKKDKKDDDEDELWERSKEHQKMPRDEFAKKVTKALKQMEVAISEIEHDSSSVNGRVYFQLRLQSLKEQIKFTHDQLVKLSSEIDDSVYSGKIKGFDRLMKSLSDHIELSQEDAGLR